MSDCECGSGLFGCSCCCASVTNLKGGLHPDSILSVSKDLVLDQPTFPLNSQTFYSDVMLPEPIHIVGVNASLVSVRRDLDTADQDKHLLEPANNAAANIAAATPVTVSLYTVPGYADGDLDRGGFFSKDATTQDRNYFCTASLTAGMPTWSADEDMFGFFCDGGLFVELNAPTPDYGVRIVVRYVPRLQFSPAYHDPVVVMQHYWKCSRGEAEFLDGFYGGTALNIVSSGVTDTTLAESITQGSRMTSVDTLYDSESLPSWLY